MTPALGGYGITHSYGTKSVLSGASLELFRGSVTALLGPNGSGKSTLLKILSGVLPLASRSEAGQVRYGGIDFFSLSHAERARTVAYVAPDLRADFPLASYDAVMMGRTCHSGRLFEFASGRDHDIVRAAMEECRCWELRHRELHTLSGGERQLVALARAIAQGARVLLLDESLSRMDLNHQAYAGRLLRKLARDEFAILLVAHDLNLASEWADFTVLLQQGQIVASGPTREVLTKDNIVRLYPGADLVVGQNPSTGAPKIFFGSGESR